jgi:hypothetical protein
MSTTRTQPRNMGTHLVSLDEAVFATLLGFFFTDAPSSSVTRSLSLLALMLGLSSTSSPSALIAGIPEAGVWPLPLSARPRFRLEGFGLVMVAAAAPSSS